MNKANYQKKITLNAMIMFLCFAIQTIIGFLVRKVLLLELGDNVLGYNAVFSNVLTILNLTELGVGIAANSYLYKAFANEDYNLVTAISNILKKTYRYIMLAIIVLGVIISFFIPIIIPKANDPYWYVYILYFLSLLSTVMSYLIAYKRTIIIADQKNYVITIIDSSCYLAISILQLVFMFIYKSYILYLILNIVKFIISAIIIQIYSSKKYNYLDKYNDLDIEKKYQKKIIHQMKDIFVAKLGGAVFNGTDNIIISSLKGSIAAGLLSNYTLVTITIQNLLSQIFSSVQATIGKYMVVTNEEKSKLNIYNVSFFVAALMGTLVMECIIFILPNFISILFGSEYVLSNYIVFFLGLNIFLNTLLLAPNQIFTIYKLYKFDKYIIIASATLNITISVILVNFYGIVGALIGTTITLLIYLISRCLIIKKQVFNDLKFLCKLVYYITITIVVFIILYFTNKFVNYNNIFYGIILNFLYTFIVSCIVFLICNIKSKEFKYLLKKYKKRIYKK